MWENNHFVKMSGRSVNMEFMYDIDMLEMIRWPSMEDTPDLFEAMASSYQGLNPYNSLFPFQHIVPCHGSSSVRSPISDDSEKRDCYLSRGVDCDDTLMVTSNDALRFEEDCLFESPSPSYPTDPHQSQSSSSSSHSSVSGVESTANRFLCQKNSMADMTLAQLNESNASDLSHKVDLAELKIEVCDFDANFDRLGENFSKSSNKSTKEMTTTSRVLPSKQSATSHPLIKDENEGHGIIVKREIKTELVSPVKCSSSLKTTKALKRCRTTSLALSADGDVKDEPIDADGLRTATSYQGHESVSISPNCCIPVGKKIKLEITEISCDIGSKVATSNNPPSTSNVSDEENADSDDLSDTESVVSKGSSVADLMRSNGLDRRYFWQYNIQAKGPKEKRLCKNIGATDPHVLKDFEDPVFDPGHSNIHFVHSGKARKGDGTDITPNPQKLLQIGCELKTLNGTIEEMMQTSSDFLTRSTTMKEKNKFASRVCRLKKKAQHEANKIKLQGLNEEHNQLMLVLNSIKSKLRQRNKNSSSAASSSSSSSSAASSSTSASSSSSSSSSVANKRQQSVNFTDELDNLTTSCLKVNVAGRADDYVSSILLSSATNCDKDDVWLYSD